jgi:septum site-determining protein MinD
MTKVIVVTSGKGGVGKTTTSANISMGLALKGYKVAVIDFDVGLRNLDLVMGCERRVVYDLVNVLQGTANLRQALIQDKRVQNLYILAASQTQDKDALTREGVEKIINELKASGFDFIICDSPAGIEHGAIMAMYYADEAIVVTNPEVSSVRDSDRMIGILKSKSRRSIEGLEPIKDSLLITRYNANRVEKGDMLNKDDIIELLSIKLLGIIPESEDIIKASNSGEPVVRNIESNASIAYKDAVARLLGEEVPMKFASQEKNGFYSKLLKLFGDK